MAAKGLAAGDSSLDAPRVLSVQSSVVHGYVGNKCAIFPLQLLGFDVDPVSSVQFSNHTGYPVIEGHVFDGQHLLQLLEGLRENGLICHTHLLSGYIGSQSLLEAVAAVARQLKQHNPRLTYVCDPVLGDEGHLYVKQELISSYKTQLLPLADILTPNQFEAELLSGLPVKSKADALAAAAALHDLGPSTVIITSMNPLPHPEYSPPPEEGQPAATSAQQQQQQQQQQQEQQQEPQPQQQHAPANDSQQQQQQQHHQHITLIASTRLPQEGGCPSKFLLRIPQLPGYFTGTGDLLAALLLAWTHKHPGNLALAVEKAVAGLQGVLVITAAAAGSAAAAVGQQQQQQPCTDDNAAATAAAAAASAAAFKAKELKLIQGQQELVNPSIKIKAEPL